MNQARDAAIEVMGSALRTARLAEYRREAGADSVEALGLWHGERAKGCAELSLLPFVNGENTTSGVLGKPQPDQPGVRSLAAAGQLKHNIVPVKLDAINDNLEALGRGDIVGRAVVVFD